MSFEPHKFFIGMIDFFSIILPGALLVFMLQDDLGGLVLGNHYLDLGGVKAWAVFLFSGYLVGHFVFLVGSGPLDYLYDKFRNATYAQIISRLASGNIDRIPNRITQYFAKRFFSDKYVDQSLNRILKIKQHYLAPLSAESSINAFQWSKIYLNKNWPEALSVVSRFEADQKFFRSLSVVLSVLMLWEPIAFTAQTKACIFSIGSCLSAGIQSIWKIELLFLFLLLLTLWRYIDQRLKSVRQAYWSVITHEAADQNGFRDQCSQNIINRAGGVVWRLGPKKANDLNEDEPQKEYLLIQPKDGSDEWVLPKGHIEANESTEQTVVREVLEEAGIYARVKQKLDTVEYQINGEHIKAQFYLLEAIKDDAYNCMLLENRNKIWVPLDLAISKVSYDEARYILESLKS